MMAVLCGFAAGYAFCRTLWESTLANWWGVVGFTILTALFFLCGLAVQP